MKKKNIKRAKVKGGLLGNLFKGKARRKDEAEFQERLTAMLASIAKSLKLPPDYYRRLSR